MVAEGPVARASLGESRTCDSCRCLPGSQGRRARQADGPAGKEGSSVTGQAVCLPTHCHRQTNQPAPRGPSPASWRCPLPRQLRGSLDTPGPSPRRSPAANLCPPATSGPQRKNLRGSEGVRPDRGPETCPQHTCSPHCAHRPEAGRTVTPTQGRKPVPDASPLHRPQPSPAPSPHPSPEEQRDRAEGGSQAPTPGESLRPEEPRDLSPQDPLLVSSPPSRASQTAEHPPASPCPDGALGPPAQPGRERDSAGPHTGC